MASLHDKLAKALGKRFGAEKATRLGKGRMASAQVREVFPTGLDVLDHYMLGVGGLPAGRATELYGQNNSGKTTLMYTMLAAVQAAGGVGVVCDADHAFDENRAAQLGVATDDLLVMTPTTLEEAFEMQREALAVLDGSTPALLAWDALGSSCTAKQQGAEAGKVQPGEIARCTATEFPKVMSKLGEKRAHWLILNQTRVNIGVMFGDNTTTPGGNAPKFHVSARFQIVGGKAVKNAANEHTGKIITLIGTKSRFVPPYRKVRLLLDYATGYSDEWATIEWAKERGLIEGRLKPAAAYEAALKAIEAKGGWSAVAGSAAVAPAEAADDAEDAEVADGDG